MCEHFSNFSPFPITQSMWGDWCSAMDGKMSHNSDQERGEACRRECQWMCFPCALSFDIVSFPFRGIYSCTKCTIKKCTELKQSPKVEILTDNQKNIINNQPK